MAAPKVTVLMAVHNGERYLAEAIDSILQQTYAGFEFIIIDDGSTDNTPDIIARYAEQDQRIVSVKNEKNIGLTRSLNRGLLLAKGQYVARMDADDVSLPDRLRLQVRVLDESPKVALVSGHLEIIDVNGRAIHHPRRSSDPDLISWYMLFYNYLGGHSQIMFRRKAVVDLGGYSESRPYSQDYELWLRLAKQGDIVIVPEVVLQWRTHVNGVSTRKRLEQDAYSLIDSGNAIAHLLGESLRLTDVVELRGFWLGQFPNSDRIAVMNNRLRRLSLQFCQERMAAQESGSDLPKVLGDLIGRQFFNWAYTLFRNADLVSMIKAGYFAILWYSSGMKFSLAQKQ